MHWTPGVRILFIQDRRELPTTRQKFSLEILVSLAYIKETLGIKEACVRHEVKIRPLLEVVLRYRPRRLGRSPHEELPCHINIVSRALENIGCIFKEISGSVVYALALS